MEGNVKQTKTLFLKLNEQEASWLHGITQNPLFGQTPEEEGPVEKRLRLAFFNVTDMSQKQGVDNVN